MKQKRIYQSLFLIGLLGLLIALNAWLNKPHKHQDKSSTTSENLVDEYMRNAQAKQYDKEGKLIETLNIEYAYHIYGESHMLLEQPKLTIERHDGQTWLIQSKKGKTVQGTEKPFDQLELSDTVEITLVEQPKEDWQMFTEHLTIVPHLEIAYTELPVTLISNQTVIHGKGMESQLKTGHIQLQSQVKSTYDIDALS